MTSALRIKEQFQSCKSRCCKGACLLYLGHNERKNSLIPTATLDIATKNAVSVSRRRTQKQAHILVRRRLTILAFFVPMSRTSRRRRWLTGRNPKVLAARNLKANVLSEDICRESVHKAHSVICGNSMMALIVVHEIRSQSSRRSH